MTTKRSADRLIMAETGCVEVSASLTRNCCPDVQTLMRRSFLQQALLIGNVDGSWRPTVRLGHREDSSMGCSLLSQVMVRSMMLEQPRCHAAKHQHQSSQEPRRALECLSCLMIRECPCQLSGTWSAYARSRDRDSETRPKPTKIFLSIVSDPHRAKLWRLRPF